MKKENTCNIKLRVYGLIAAGIAVVLGAIFVNQFQFHQKALQFSPNDKTETQDTLKSEFSKVDSLIQDSMIDSGMPGLSVAIVHNGQTVYKSGFGFADMQTGAKATSKTLFQIGSNSKAFTALGVLQLQKKGLISLNDPIVKYLPWLKLYYQDREATVTIEQFLHHTSGISANTIVSIPELSGPRALEQTVKTIAGSELKAGPGERYEYATINYDVLGLLIEKVTGSTYEEYMQENVLQPMGLKDTQMYREQAGPDMVAKGYKLQFLAPAAYQAPVYDGNKPAGYILSDADDMAEWLKIQMGTSAGSIFDNALIKESHAPNTSVAPFGKEMRYAEGWIVYDNRGTEIFHSGSNPNYSSYIAFRPAKKIGVAVLCNISSASTTYIGEGIMNILLQRPAGSVSQDIRQLYDTICSFIAVALLFFIAKSVYKLIPFIKHTGGKENRSGTVNVFMIVISTVITVLIGAAIYLIPGLVFNQSTWGYLFVWYPSTIIYIFILAYVLIALSYCNTLFRCLRRPTE